MRDNKELLNDTLPDTTHHVHRHLGSFKSKDRLSRIFAELPLIAYRRPKNLPDKLVSSNCKEKTKQGNTNSCKPRGRTECSWRRKINFTTTCSDTKGERTFQINHKLGCYSAWVMYMMLCKICKLVCIGKSQRKCNIRFINQRSHIRK